MTKLNNNFSIMVALLSSMIAASMVVATGFKFTIPPEPEPGFYKTIAKCTKKISTVCGENVVKAVLEDQNISKQCCIELVHGLGRNCHEDLLWFYASQPNLGVSATHVFTKGPRVWNSCVLKAATKI
ncbi:hypothetical protein HRI_003905500 [Hibiscus trionum]|uniref:Prolamin-like domain-containing protein n=1 Tax=Hibiscus trionum TaxID=183268 RepID=A0A9W7MFN6_HIBTR|nr:hypothetical protein HRI_003905500 [Hibiscus trionum]